MRVGEDRYRRVVELRISRCYFAGGTNGLLSVDGLTVCFTIELPWKNNTPLISCIPCGSYPIQKRYSTKFGWHLHVQRVPGRSLILLHPANNAIEELQGCIAPVSSITGAGTGCDSRIAFQKVMGFAVAALDRKEPVFLTIVPAL